MALNKQAKNVKKFWNKAAEKASFGKKGQEKIGNYKEAAGGGTPIEKGESFKLVDNPYEADAIREQEKNLPENQKTNIRVKQPRNEDGTFGYNSQNRRGLRYPSRGTTIPDFLKEYVAIWHKQGKSLDDPITSQDAEYMLTFDMTMRELIERSKYYLEDENTFSFLAGKGDVVQTKHNDGSAKTKSELDKDLKVAQGKRNPIMAQRAATNPQNLSFRNNIGINGKKVNLARIMNKAIKMGAATQQQLDAISNLSVSHVQSLINRHLGTLNRNNNNNTVPTQPVKPTNNAPSSTNNNNANAGSFTHKGKTYTAQQMNNKLTAINNARKSQGKNAINMGQLRQLIGVGKIPMP